MSRLFVLTGIKSPGKVNLPKLGTVNLEELSDDDALNLYKAGCPFLIPSPEGLGMLYPDAMPITVGDISIGVPAVKKRKRK